MTAWASASGLYRYAREIETTLNRFINPSLHPDSMGFSGTGRIGSVAEQKGTTGDRVAIRVDAAETPGYLRGKVFDTYTHGQWARTEQKTVLYPSLVDELAAHVSRNPLDEYFRLKLKTELSTGTSSDTERLDIWPAQSFHEVLFSPLQSVAIQAPVDHLSIDVDDAVSADNLAAGSRYRVWRKTSREGAALLKPGLTWTLSLAEHARYTGLPDNLDPRIGDLARGVVGEAVTTGDKIAAITSFFHEYYEYQFGIDVPTQRDPVEYFLLERPPAHCEYFASGAAMLLRSVDVPCRYVTGLVVAENNSIGDYWIARNRDAHAWVEAFDPERGWVIVEATPASGVPDSTSSSPMNQSWDAVHAKWQQWVATIRSLGMSGVILVVATYLIHPVALLLYVLLAIAVILSRFQRRRRKKTKLSVDPRTALMHSLLSRVDEHWQRVGLIREPHETLHQFADRLESFGASAEHDHAAQWYRRFAAIRYSGAVNDRTIDSLGEPGASASK